MSAAVALSSTNKPEVKNAGIKHEPLLTTFRGLKGKVGIFGGTFDPLTRSHIALAEAAAKWHNLDSVVFIPTSQNPLKTQSPVASHQHRLGMIRESLVNHPNWFVSPIQEIDPRLRLSADLLAEIKNQVDEDLDLYLILGSDCVADFPKWKLLDEIEKNSKIAVISREGTDLNSALKNLPVRVRENIEKNLIPGCLPSESASQLRDALALNHIPENILPEVKDYIDRFGLYKNNQRSNQEFFELSANLRDFSRLYRALSSTSPEDVARNILTLPDSERSSAIDLLKKAILTAPIILSQIKPGVIENEKRRKVSSLEPQKLSLERAILFVKESKIECDLRIRNISYEELLEQYKGEDVKVAEVVNAHIEHKKSLKLLEEALPELKVKVVGRLSPEEANMLTLNCDLVVAAGGDDTIKLASSYVKDQFFIGLNTAPSSSHGALCYFDAQKFLKQLPEILDGKFEIEEWTRLAVEATISNNGTTTKKSLPPSLSEVVIAEENFFFTMRGALKYHEKDFKIKGSGLIVGTGAGSTGWLASGRQHVYPLGKPWPKTKRYGEFGNIMSFVDGGEQIETGEVLPERPLIFTSSGNRNPTISGDSVWFQKFPRGSKAKIGISDTPLKVIVPK